MSRVEENDQTLKMATKCVTRVNEIAEENNFSAEYIAVIITKVVVIGLLGDISRSLAVIADKEKGDENSKRNTKEDA